MNAPLTRSRLPQVLIGLPSSGAGPLAAAARREAQKLRQDGAEVANTVERRAAHLTAWSRRQRQRLAELNDPNRIGSLDR